MVGLATSTGHRPTLGRLPDWNPPVPTWHTQAATRHRLNTTPHHPPTKILPPPSVTLSSHKEKQIDPTLMTDFKGLFQKESFCCGGIGQIRYGDIVSCHVVFSTRGILSVGNWPWWWTYWVQWSMGGGQGLADHSPVWGRSHYTCPDNMGTYLLTCVT